MRATPFFGILLIGLSLQPSLDARRVRSLEDAGSPSSMTRFRTVQGDLITVEAHVNGQGPFRFLLDTGANASIVSTRLVSALGLPLQAGRTVLTAAGLMASAGVTVDELRLGPVVGRHLNATVLGEGNLRHVDPSVDGVVGQDVLGDEDYTIDYTHHRVLWGAAAPAGPKTAVFPLRWDGGRWLVGLVGPSRPEPTTWFVPDSGATALVVFDRGHGLPIPISPSMEMRRTNSVTGGASARAAVVDSFQVGPVDYYRQPALVIDRKEPDAPAGDGLLPLCVFGRVHFAPRERTLTAEPR
jgi:hypothetical protein